MKYDWGTKEVKAIRKKLIEKLAERCWIELEYDDVVNKRIEKVDYKLIVECVLRHWSMGVLKCFGQ